MQTSLDRVALDHVVLATKDLASGASWLQGLLGVALQPGGQHAFMGTHNMLLSLGAGAYLELIAIDPSLPAPLRPRWFDLDNAALRARLQRGPCLLHWVVRVPDLDAALAAHPQPVPRITAAARGALRWRIGISDVGALPLHGVFPTVIEWQGAHPCDALPDSGVVLSKLGLASPNQNLSRHLEGLGVNDGRITCDVAATRLTATLETPRGVVKLHGADW